MNLQSIIAKLKLITVEPILFLYMMIIFMESNALQELIYIKSCIMLKNPVNISECSYALKANQTDATNLATTWSKYTDMCLFIFTFITTFYVGSWSDRLGRKLPMLIPPIGTVIAACINAVLSYFIRIHMAYFFISSFISGVTFGTVGIIATTYGYISDFTLEQSRTKRIIILESMIFIGGTVGIKTAGLFLKHVHYEWELNNFVMLFIFEAIISAGIAIYIIFRIPSYSSDSQSLYGPLSWSSLFSLRHVGDSLKTVFRFREEGKRAKIILMLIALSLTYMGSVVQLTLSYYFLRTINWNFDEYTNFHSIQFAVEGLALICIYPLLHRFPRVPDHCIGMLGLFSRFTGLVVFGLSALSTNHDYMVYSCIILYMFSEFPVPALRSILSKTVASDERGRIFAFTTVLQNICFLLGSFSLMTVFTETSFHGLSFEVAAGLQGIAFVIMLYLYLTRSTYITAYETIEHDGSVSEICSVAASTGSVNS
ncbi:proton-coupled folate transporter-like isoform X2 [Argiope bruennichi]|uniref:proton-coupled folate transporter-like isoform X2 n=1 Tax=Argiope bruennichi TaxID=94029 RepID=UPI0024944122|nr:proton-coupled folate transporter-like isoform X2 [Argiope bruennichi]